MDKDKIKEVIKKVGANSWAVLSILYACKDENEKTRLQKTEIQLLTGLGRDAVNKSLAQLQALKWIRFDKCRDNKGHVSGLLITSLAKNPTYGNPSLGIKPSDGNPSLGKMGMVELKKPINSKYAKTRYNIKNGVLFQLVNNYKASTMVGRTGDTLSIPSEWTKIKAEEKQKLFESFIDGLTDIQKAQILKDKYFKNDKVCLGVLNDFSNWFRQQGGGGNINDEIVDAMDYVRCRNNKWTIATVQYEAKKATRQIIQQHGLDKFIFLVDAIRDTNLNANILNEPLQMANKVPKLLKMIESNNPDYKGKNIKFSTATKVSKRPRNFYDMFPNHKDKPQATALQVAA